MITLVLIGKAFLVSFLWMSLLWIIHLLINNAAIVDVGWGVGVFLYSLVYFFESGEGINMKEYLCLLLVMAWSMRLSLFLFVDRIYKQEEEGRYKTLREKWKTNISEKFFLFYQAQGVFNIFLTIPFLLIALADEEVFSFIFYMGYLLSILGIIGETTADLQLKFFKMDKLNKGKICRMGLWNWSRHPNYFFEFIFWLGIGIITIPSPMGWIGLIAPLIILTTLLKVTGIPATEAQAIKSRGDLYRQYQKEVNMFIPLPPKRVS